MKKILLLIVVVALVIAYFTNPSVEKHQQAAKQMAEQIVENKLSSFNIPTAWLNVGNDNIADKTIDKLINQYVSVDNYYLFSLTKMKWEREEYFIGVGVFGCVFIPDKVEDIFNQKIDEYLQNQIEKLIPNFN